MLVLDILALKILVEAVTTSACVGRERVGVKGESEVGAGMSLDHFQPMLV